MPPLEQDILDIVNNPKVARVDTSVSWYICASKGDNPGHYYLHDDGIIREGTGEVDGSCAYWPSEFEARTFCDAWRYGYKYFNKNKEENVIKPEKIKKIKRFSGETFLNKLKEIGI